MAEVDSAAPAPSSARCVGDRRMWACGRWVTLTRRGRPHSPAARALAGRGDYSLDGKGNREISFFSLVVV